MATGDESTLDQGDLDSALLDAATTGDTTRVAALLDAGADVGHANEYGFNPLGSALWESHLETASLLVDRGSPVDVEEAAALGDVAALDAEWPTPPRVEDMIGAYLGSCRTGQVDVIGWFLERGVPVDLHPPGDEWGGIGSPGLHHAAVNGHVRAVRVLLDAGADPALVDDVYGSQALAWAATAGHAVVVDELLAAGADARHHNDHGRTAAGLARDNGFPELADQLESLD